jgi:type IV pilus assembly protein PilN
MRIFLNLATRPFTDLGPTLKRLRIAMGVLMLVAIAAGAGVYMLDQKASLARLRENALDLKIARVNAERRGYEAMMREPQNAAVLAQAQNLNQLFDEKGFSWTLAMEDLETVLPGGVQVTTLEPTRDKDGHITLRLHVLGARDRSLEFVQNLEHSKRFVSPRIVGESAEGSTGPNQRFEPVSASNRMNFDLLADYVPAPPGERRPVKAAAADHAGQQPHMRPALPTMPRGVPRSARTGMPLPIAPARQRPGMVPMQPRPGGPQ